MCQVKLFPGMPTSHIGTFTNIETMPRFQRIGISHIIPSNSDANKQEINDVKSNENIT